jgi:diacylglycerol O-acyltransferase
VIEGLQRGRFALVAKIHHAAVDGVGGALLMCGLLDTDREIPPLRAAEAAPEPEPAPSTAALLADAAYSLGAQPLRGARQLLRTTGTGARLAFSSFAKREFSLPSAPRTRLNGRVTGRRAVALGSVPLDDVKQVKNAYASTVNHVVLAACAGALRRYLCEHGELPEQPLVAAVPMALADRPADGLGNSITPLLMRLPVQLSDPLERLRASREASFEAMRTQELIGNQLNEWADLLAPSLLAGASQLYTRLGLADYHAPLVNLVISNVPGPGMSLYCAGSRVTACHPLGPIYNGCSLNLTVMSYAGSLGIGAIGCPDTVPGLAEIPRAFEDEVADLLQIAHGGTATIAAAS